MQPTKNNSNQHIPRLLNYNKCDKCGKSPAWTHNHLIKGTYCRECYFKEVTKLLIAGTVIFAGGVILIML